MAAAAVVGVRACVRGDSNTHPRGGGPCEPTWPPLTGASPPAGAEMAVARAEIVRREESELSLMPDNFSEVIPESEFRHLLAYLLAQKSAAR